MSVIEFFECVRQTIRLEALGKKSLYQSFVSSRKFTVLGTTASIPNKLGSINTTGTAEGVRLVRQPPYQNFQSKDDFLFFI